MANSDLLIAKQELKEKNLNLVIVKSKKIILATKEYGITGLIKAVDRYGEELHGSSIADMVVGKAAAMLCRYARIVAVYAGVMSKTAVDVLIETGIKFEYDKLVANILNRSKTDVCPFEKLTADCTDEKECYERIKNFLGSRPKNTPV